MPALLLELFSEEIPARMQARAAADLSRLLSDALAPLQPGSVETFHGPRRIALAATLRPEVPAAEMVERGPRASAPPQALEGFLRKHGATREQLADENGHWVLRRTSPGVAAAALVAQVLPGLLRRFPWPKSMRWGAGSAFVWVRPLRRILCLLDGAVVPFGLAEGADDGHGLRSGDETEGHRFLAPGAFAVHGLEQWRETLREHRVIADAGERRRRVADGVARLAAAEGLTVVPDEALLDEVTNLVEWPVPLLGHIDAAFMDLPAEVMQVSMRVNQRYFALRTADGAPAPRFAFAANIEALDGGATIVAGNERVLRARFSDARHFWDLDRRTHLADRVDALEGVTFHAKLGSQRARVDRIVALARALAPMVGADSEQAARAALLAKADLTTGMVGEFPELQGVMGGYYARHDGETQAVAEAVRDHYAPRGPADPAPTAPVTIAVALADKLDQLASFFMIEQAPSGSGDPFGLRRGALGVIRIVRENKLRFGLLDVLDVAVEHATSSIRRQSGGAGGQALQLRGVTEHHARAYDVADFIAERLRVQLRAEGARHDMLSAVHGAKPDDDILRLLARTEALAAFLATPDGADLLTGARRAANIVRIEDKKDDRQHDDPVDPALLAEPAERALYNELGTLEGILASTLAAERYTDAMLALAQLRPKLDAMFDQVTINAPEPALRENRLRLLACVGTMMGGVADLSRIEG